MDVKTDRDRVGKYECKIGRAGPYLRSLGDAVPASSTGSDVTNVVTYDRPHCIGESGDTGHRQYGVGADSPFQDGDDHEKTAPENRCHWCYPSVSKMFAGVCFGHSLGENRLVLRAVKRRKPPFGSEPEKHYKIHGEPDRLDEPIGTAVILILVELAGIYALGFLIVKARVARLLEYAPA